MVGASDIIYECVKICLTRRSIDGVCLNAKRVAMEIGSRRGVVVEEAVLTSLFTVLRKRPMVAPVAVTEDCDGAGRRGPWRLLAASR